MTDRDRFYLTSCGLRDGHSGLWLGRPRAKKGQGWMRLPRQPEAPEQWHLRYNAGGPNLAKFAIQHMLVTTSTDSGSFPNWLLQVIDGPQFPDSGALAALSSQHSGPAALGNSRPFRHRVSLALTIPSHPLQQKDTFPILISETEAYRTF